MKNYVPAGDVLGCVSQLDAHQFSPDLYRTGGVFVLRQAIPDTVIRTWQAAWSQFCADVLGNRQVDPFNPVVVREAAPPPLCDIHRCAPLLDVVEQVYPDLALYMQRFVVKDRQSRTPVFLHQDVGYDIGWPEKTSVFVPLSLVNRDNGGLVLYPGTHALGYMGDAGELNRELLDPAWPALCPAFDPGDIVLMHECTWHGSGPHVSGPDRVLVQITYQPASDPTGVELLRGRWRTAYRLADVPRERFFTRSRASRLRELQAEVERLTTARIGA